MHYSRRTRDETSADQSESSPQEMKRPRPHAAVVVCLLSLRRGRLAKDSVADFPIRPPGAVDVSLGILQEAFAHRG